MYITIIIIIMYSFMISYYYYAYLYERCNFFTPQNYFSEFHNSKFVIKITNTLKYIFPST